MDVPLPGRRLAISNTLEFLLSPTRDAEAAKRFFLKALHSSADSAPQAHLVEEQVAEPTAAANPVMPAPRVINVDKNAAYPKATAELKASGALAASVELRQVKYLNNLVEQDHRFIKRLVKPGMGFFSFETAWRTLQGYEVMHMLRKGQVQGVGKGDIQDQVTFIARNGPRPLTPAARPAAVDPALLRVGNVARGATVGNVARGATVGNVARGATSGGLSPARKGSLLAHCGPLRVFAT